MEAAIASVTTSYNGVRVLPRHIDALLKQTRMLREIVVVDNGSTDGTSAMLAERYPQVTVLRLEQNLGAAGGWAEGLKYAAIEKGYDWVWNFDDDSVPGPDALDKLLSAVAEIGDSLKIGIAVPLPVHEKTNTPYPPLFWRDGFVKPGKDILRKPFYFADMAIASGALVRREMVREIGFPRADFFMDFFDFEYSMRARQRGYKVAVITACKFAHEIGNAQHVQFLGFNRLWTVYPPWREYYIARNLCFAAWHLYPSSRAKRFAALYVLRRATRILSFGRRRIETVKKMLRGLLDGARGKLGIVFTPN